MTRLLKPLSGVVGAGFKYDVRSTDMSLKATNDYTTVDLSGAVNVLKINNQSGMVKQIPVKATSYSISFKVADLGDLTPGNYTMELWSQKDGVTTVYPDTSTSVTNITIGSMHLDGLDSPVVTVFIKSFESATPEYIEDARAKMDAYNVHAEMRNNAIYVNGFMVLDLNPQSPSSGGGGSAGIKGDTGDSAYDLWLKQGHSGTLQDYLNWTKGEQGIQGTPGRDGESAYETWIRNGHRGSEQDFLNSLRGPQGEHGEALTIKATSDSYQSGKTYGELVITGPNKRTMRGFSRGITILVFDMDLNLQAQRHFDTYVNYPGDVTNAANYLKGLAKSIVVVIEADAAGLNKDLVDQLVKMGATDDLYGLPMVANRRVLSFIGMSADYGLKPGQGYLAITNGSDAQSATVFAQVGGQGIALNGADGESAYEIWKRNGHQNDSEATFLNSLRGSKGDKGDKGNQGDKGDKGDPGAEGAPGRDGEGTMYWQWVDLTASKFDQNKWYPVVKNGGVPATKFNVFAASHELDPGEFKPSWATHKNGFTVSCRYLANYPAWGAIPTNGIIEAEEGCFISDETCPVHFDIHAQNGGYVFYLRGGARYQLGDNLRNMTWQVYDGTYSINGISFDPLDKEPVSFKRTYNNWPTRTKIIDLPALAELGGVSDVNLLPQITPTMRMAGGSNEISTPHGSAQRFNNYTTGVEILPKVDVMQKFLKGDDIRQSAIIRTDGTLKGVCFSYYTNEDGHRFMPCIIRALGNNNYLITCKWRADKDVNIRSIDITKMDISGHTYVEIDKPFIGISQVGGVIPTNCLTGFNNKNTGIANFGELGLMHITASGTHSYLDPVQYNLNIQPNKKYHLKFLAWGTGQFRTFMYPGAVLAENGSGGDGLRTWYLQGQKPTWYETDVASLPAFYGNENKKLLFRSDSNQTTDLWLDLNSVTVTEVGGVIKTLVLPNILKKPTTFNPNIDSVQWPAEWSKGQWRSASGGAGKRYGIAISASDSPIGKPLTAFHIESTSVSTGTVDVAQDNIPIHNSTYTLSVWARGKGKAGLHVADKHKDGSWFYPLIYFDLTSEWKRYELTTQITGTDTTNVYIGFNQAGGVGDFAAPKFEEGAVATAFVDQVGGGK